MISSYLLPLTEIRREMTVVNSRFISTLAPALSIDVARAFMARIRKEFADATHNVPVYIIGGGNTVTEYFSDDGESSGAAGKPALAVLRGSGLGDAMLVINLLFVFRFFGMLSFMLIFKQMNKIFQRLFFPFVDLVWVYVVLSRNQRNTFVFA